MVTMKKFKKRKISNMTLAIPDDDDYVYCDECNFEYMGDCPKHQGFNIVSDTEIFKNRQPSHIVDGDDPSDSNWMRFINCARFEEEQCLTAFQYKGQIYYRAHRDIYPGSEILVHYGDMYAQELGIQLQYKEQKPTRNHDVKPKGVVYCHFCPLTFPSVNAYVKTHWKYKHAQHYWREHHGIDNVVSQLNKTMQTENYKENSQAEGKRKTLPPEVERETVHTGWETIQTEDKNKTVQTENRRKSSLTEDERETDDSKINFLEISQISNEFRENCEKNSGVSLKNVRVFVNTSEIEKLHCDICKNFFSSKDSLTAHKLEHTAENNYLCDVGSKIIFLEILQISNEFSEKCEKNLGVSLNTVKVLVNTSEIEKLQCDICKKYFACKDSLTAHKLQHIGEKQYHCDVCGYKTEYLANVNRHKLTHTREKHYQCNVCRFKTAYLVNLNRHKLTHSGEKPYKCNVCTFKTAHLANLNSHKFTHTGEKPYKCNVCTFKTAYLANLNRHTFTHTGEKPYTCDLCTYKCIRLSYLKTHKHRHTGEKPYASMHVQNYKLELSQNP